MADAKDTKDSKDTKTTKTERSTPARGGRAPRGKQAAITAGELSALKNISKARAEKNAEAEAPVVDKEERAAEPKVYVQKLDAKGRAQATGKRKNAIARVWIWPGNGKITVNDRDVATYFARPVLQMVVRQPLAVVDRAGQFDVMINVIGGGLSGQAGAVKHGISKALTLYEPGLRPVLKKAGFLTRDSRVVERKKYGKPKARRSFQFSKR